MENEKSKTNIDKFFTDNYDDLNLYALKVIKLYKRKYEASDVISYAYIHMCKYILTNNKVLQLSDVEGLTKHYIKNNIKWENSFLNNGIAKYSNINYSSDLVEIDNQEKNNDLNTLYIEYITEEFIDTLSAIDKILFEMYYYKDLNKISKIRKHLRISQSSAYETYLECKAIYYKFEQYIKNKIQQ